MSVPQKLFQPVWLTIIIAFIISCSVSACKKAGDKPVVVSQILLPYFNEDTAQGYLEDLRKADVSVVLLSCTDIFLSGPERDSLFSRFHDASLFFEKEGFEVGVWTTSLGYGNQRPKLEAMYPAFKRLTNFNGDTGGAACSTDPEFLEIIKQNIRDFAKAGARFILMDDELVQSVRPGFTCVCDNHLALLKEATGKDFTREQVRDLFTGAPNPDRTAFLDVMGKSMEDFCKGLREAADEVNPDIVMAICSSYTHFDAEGVDMEKLSRILAGKGHKSFLRLSGATYWPATWHQYPGLTLADVVDFVRMQVGWMRGRDIILFDENDPHPRRTEIVPAPWCELYDKVMIANGGVNRHKYMFCFGPDNPDRGYLEAHLANMEDDKELMDMFCGTSPCGFRVWESEHRLRDINLPDKYPDDQNMMVRASRSAGSFFLTANSIPVCFEGSGIPGIAFGDQARLLPREAIGNGLILDVPAALALQSRGIDVGLESAVPIPTPQYEEFSEGTVPFISSGGRYFNVIPRKDAEAEVLSSFIHDGDKTPSCLVCKTGDGLFAIYGWDGFEMFSLESRPWNGPLRTGQLKSLYRKMSGGKDISASLGNPVQGIYLLPALSRDGKRLTVLVCNMADGDSVASLDIPEGWTVSRTLRTGVPAESGGNFILATVPANDWCAIEFK